MLHANKTNQVTKIGGPFSLIDGAGHQVTQADFRGRFTLVYFGYTLCPDICPTTLQQIDLAMERLGPAAARVQPLFITVDPARDTPAVIARYTATISPRVLGLTGSAAAINAVAHEYHIHIAPGHDSSMDHSAVIYLMGPDGTLITPIRADAPAPAIAADIIRHLT